MPVSKHLNETHRGASRQRGVPTGDQRASYDHVVGKVRVVLRVPRALLTTHLHPDRGVAALISGRDAAPLTWFGSEKELNRFLHSSASRFLSLCSIDVVHVVALKTVRERREEFRSLGINVECIRQILGYHCGTGFLVQSQGDANRIAPSKTGLFAHRGAHAHQMLTAITPTVVRKQ